MEKDHPIKAVPGGGGHRRQFGHLDHLRKQRQQQFKRQHQSRRRLRRRFEPQLYQQHKFHDQ